MFGGNQGNKLNKISKLKNIKNLDDKEILNMITNFLGVQNLSEQKLNEIIGNYVYTADNFIKVILVLLRIRSKVPVIMMGETGCGKTTLIEMAFNLINKGKIPIKKLNIHSGVKDNDIIDFINKINKEVEKEDKLLNENNSRDIWIFFDEINTI